MQRQRGELVPIGEAFGGLDGPVQAIRDDSPLARHLQARPLQGGNHRGAIRDGPCFDALAQIVGNQPPGIFLRLQPGPKLGGLDVRPMAGLHVPRPLGIVRAAPAVFVVLPIP